MIEPSLSLSCAVNYPDEPRHSARQPQLAEVGDPPVATGRGEIALVHVAEGLARLTLQRPQQLLGDQPTHLVGGRHHPRNYAVVLPQRGPQVFDCLHLGMARNRHVPDQSDTSNAVD